MSSMTIGIDGRLFGRFGSGIACYTWHLAQQLSLLYPEDTYVLFTNQPNPPKENSILYDCYIPGKQRALWSSLRLTRGLKQHKISLYHATANFDAPLFTDIPTVITLHDMIPLTQPDYVSAKHRWITKIQAQIMSRKALHFICDSEYTRNELKQCFNIDDAKISVIPLASGDEFQTCRGRSDFSKVLGKYHLQPGYLLTLSALEPRKNLPFLISAYEQMRNNKQTELPLVIAGPPWFKSETITRRIDESPWKNDIISTGFIEQDDLPYIYSGADLFVLPSLYEGFGLPLLEALGCGVPCVVSNRTSLPEIGGDAVLYFDPTKQDELIQAMDTLLQNEALRQDLVTRGLERGKQYSWEQTARLTHEIYSKVLSLIS